MHIRKEWFKRLLSIFMSVCCVLGMIPVGTAYATESYHTITYNSGWGYATSSVTVWYNSTGSTAYGSVSAGEGFTIISKANGRYCVNYSISSAPGWKEGWIDEAYVDTQYMSRSKAGVINSSTVTLYCPFTNSVQSGSVSVNERVSVLGEVNNYYQIEYNTTNGRKCGWVPINKVTLYNNGGQILWRFMDGSSPTPDNAYNTTGSTISVYKSPYITSTANGSIANGEYFRAGGAEFINGVYFIYVEYYYGNPNNNIWKSGFIIL